MADYFRAISTRMVAGMWWFFTLIMISSYTANLAGNKALILLLDSCLPGLEDIIYIWKTLSFHSLILSAQYFSH